MDSRFSHTLVFLLLVAGCSSNSDEPPARSEQCYHDNATSETNANGECVIDQCTEGFDDCDGDDSNGCETSLNDSNANCGACDNDCSADNVVGACVDGACSGDFRCVSGHFDLNGDEDDGCESTTPCPDAITVGDLCHTRYVSCALNAGCYTCDYNPNLPDPAAWAETSCTEILPEEGCPNFAPDDVACTSVGQMCSYRTSGIDCWLSYACDADSTTFKQIGCEEDAEACEADAAVDDACPTDGAACVTAEGQCMMCRDGKWIAECG